MSHLLSTHGWPLTNATAHQIALHGWAAGAGAVEVFGAVHFHDMTERVNFDNSTEEVHFHDMTERVRFDREVG